MTACWLVAAFLVTLGAAVRSTWSPCGLSMLATITPLSERGRGHRYRATAAWFVAGGVLGGVTLGTVAALLALGVHAMHLTPRELSMIALGLSLVTVASDIGLRGFRLPVHHRQVNERWLDQFRPWVYGAGFGWQIGSGLATYIVTAAVYLMVGLSALIGNPWLAVGVGALFGLVRGLAVYLGRHITSSDALRTFHQWFNDLGPTVRRATIRAEVAVGALLAWTISPWAALGFSVGALVWAFAARTDALATRRSGSLVGVPVRE
jgi:MFS family permease